MSDEASSSIGTWCIWLVGIAAIIVGLVIFLILLRKYIQGGQYKKPNRIDGKVVIVTGCNIGIGKETVRELAARGAHIHMACRNMQKCDAAREEIISQTGNHNIFSRHIDLSSLESVRAFAKKFIDEEPRLDILINNAGLMMLPRSETSDGIEMQLCVNHMGPFLLTNLLLDLLKKSAPSRIIVTSSILHLLGKIDKDDLNSERSYGKVKAYCQSKLANLLFVRELSKRLDGTGVTVNALHPGVVMTELGRHLCPTFIEFILKVLLTFFFKSPQSGAQTTLAVAVDEDLAQISGKYFSDCKVKKPARKAENDEDAQWLWEESEKWTKLTA